MIAAPSMATPEQHHEMMMHGMYGTYPMERDASGTSWEPASTRMPGHSLNGVLLESAIEIQKTHVIFGRAEYVEKDELFIPPNRKAGKIFDAVNR